MYGNLSNQHVDYEDIDDSPYDDYLSETNMSLGWTISLCVGVVLLLLVAVVI